MRRTISLLRHEYMLTLSLLTEWVKGTSAGVEERRWRLGKKYNKYHSDYLAVLTDWDRGICMGGRRNRWMVWIDGEGGRNEGR